jgi:hypothetical protein
VVTTVEVCGHHVGGNPSSSVSPSTSVSSSLSSSPSSSVSPSTSVSSSPSSSVSESPSPSAGPTGLGYEVLLVERRRQLLSDPDRREDPEPNSSGWNPRRKGLV